MTKFNQAIAIAEVNPVGDLAVYAPQNTTRCVVETLEGVSIINAEDEHAFVHTVLPAYRSAQYSNRRAAVIERLPDGGSWSLLAMFSAGVPRHV
jgi:hypothetical protein